MASKKKELETLEKIADLIESVGGDDSYIGKAFEGCYLLARSNIENDFMESWKERSDVKHEEGENLRRMMENERKTADALRDLVESEQSHNERIEGERDELARKLDEANALIEDMNKEHEADELKIMRLKAKLYDAMTREG